MRRALFAGLTLVAGLTLALAACSSIPAVPLPVFGNDFGTPTIDIAAAAKGRDWTVRYRLPKPARQLVFVRSPDDSRVRLWSTDAAFEIVATPDGEIARRRDGKSFRDARFRMAPRYSALPKDYAPFSPYGDGGVLFHTGRFFACGDAACPDDARFAMHIAGPGHILIEGNRPIYNAEWTDQGDGRNVYLGETQPLSTSDFIAVFDTSLPGAIRESLTTEFPSLMRQLGDKLGKLDQRPMLFASYGVTDGGEWGRQGGALPGQVFVHFYGNQWPAEMAKPDFAASLTWFFAHEAAHIWQRQLYSSESEGAWIHEGGAEAFAALAMRDGASEGSYVATKISEARKTCEAERKGRSIREALAAGAFDVSYSCGLLINLAIDEGVRRANPKADGLYAVWRDYIASSAAKKSPTEVDFLASISRIGGEHLASAVHAQLRAVEPKLDAL